MPKKPKKPQKGLKKTKKLMFKKQMLADANVSQKAQKV